MERNYLILSLLLLSGCAVLVVGQRNGDVRLAGFESSKLMGRLEMFLSGSWYGICNDGFGTRELAVACRQLGLGNGVRVYNPDTDAANKTRYGNAGRKDPVIVRFGGATILLELGCVGTENYLLNCGFSTSHDCISTEAVAVQCSEYLPQPYSGQVRLVGGDYPSEGIVQVYFNGEWGIVCDPGFDGNATLAVCRQLGYSSGSASIGATSYGSPSGPVWVTSLSCGGSERCLSSCLSSTPSSPGSCSSNGFATVTCGYGGTQVTTRPRECEMSSTPGEGSLRLVDVRGAPHSGANGTLQVYMNGQWGGFCGLTSNCNRESLDVICRQLGYRTWASTGSNTISGGTMHITNISCTGVEDNVFGCQYGNTSMSQCGNTYLFVTCHPDVFGVAMYGSVTISGTADGAGLLFVRGSRGFGPICDRDFDLVDGGVACRQMGYEGVYAVPKGSYYGRTGASPAVTHITCEGSESRLLSCSHRRDSTQLCTSNSLAGVHCTANASDTNRGSLRLADGNSSSGLLEISLDGRWWAVCSTLFSTAAANVACRQLGSSGGAVGYTNRTVQDSGVADIFTVVGCRGSEQRLYDCSYLTLPRTLCPTGVILTCECRSPSKEEMCSSLFGLRNQTLSPSSTSGNCSVSESCTTLSCALTVVYSVFNIPLSLETTLLPCSEPYGVHLLITSTLLGGVVVNDTFTQSRNFTISVLGSNADVIVDITQQCYGLTLSVRVFLLGNVLEFMPPTDIFMFCPPPPEVNCSFSQPSYSVTEGGTVNVTILTSSAGFSFPFTVNLRYMDGSAEQNVDYIQSVTTVDFSPGQSSATFAVATVEDNSLETLENFKIMIVSTSEPDMASVGSPNMATIAIEDNDVALTLSIRPQNYTVVEGQTVIITLELDSDAFDDDFNVTLVHMNASATAPGDYMSGPYTVTFKRGQRTAILMVATVIDSIAELNESFKVRITSTSTPDMIVVGDDDTSYVTIVDNDVITCSTASENATVTEGGVAGLTVECSGQYEFDFTLFLNAMDGSAVAPGDYIPGGYSLSFPAGQTSSVLSVSTLEDNLAELEEFFKVMITRSDRPDKVLIGDPRTGYVTIEDNDVLTVRFVDEQYRVVEGSDTVVNLGITANKNFEFPFNVPVNTMDGNATVANGDYTPGGYVARFTPGSRRTTVAVNISDDHKLEGYEYFTARLSLTDELRNRNVRIGSRKTATIDIEDDEREVHVSFSPATYTVSESEGQVTITLVASRTLQIEYTVSVELTGGTSQEMSRLGGSAANPEDYANGTYQVVFPPGERSAKLKVPINDDDVCERNEKFVVMLDIPKESAVYGVRAGTPMEATVTIEDDDVAEVQFDPATYVVTEGDAVVSISVDCGACSHNYTVGIACSNGTATSILDYFEPTSVVICLSGQTASSIDLIITDDPVHEPIENFTCSFTNLPDGVSMGSNSVATVVIEDDDDVIVTSSEVVTSSQPSSSLEPVLTETSTPSPSPKPISTPSATPTSSPPGVELSFDSSEYSTREGSVVKIVLTANSTTKFAYAVEINVNDITTTAGLDYNVTSLNVTMRAGERSAMFNVGIIDDEVVERRESFQCTVSKIHTPSQGIPIEWDQVPATVIIDDDDNSVLEFLVLDHNQVYENVSSISVGIRSSGNASFRYTVDLIKVGKGTAKEGSDFVLPEVVFLPYQRSAIVNVLIIDDEMVEELENFTIAMRVSPDLRGSIIATGSIYIGIKDDDSCPEYFIFPRTTVGEVATIPCSTDGSGSGMYGNIESKCEKGGVWGRVDMSQCTFRRDVPSHPILWMVELRSTNLTSLKQLISELGQAQNVIVNKQGRSSNSDRSVYFIQALNDDIVNRTRSVIGSKLIKENVIMRRNGCNCCKNAKIDLFNSNSTYTEICEGEGSIQVPCSCRNGENECDAFYLDEDSKCYLDTDQDSKPDVNDPCVECCPQEFNIFQWPKRDYGVTVEANCSEIHPSFGGSKVSRTCRQNDTWDPVDISSCTFKNTTGSTPIILFNATVNGSDTNEAREILREQARNLVPGNASLVNVTVTEVATVETTASNQTVVIFVIEFTENTTLVENFTTAISEPSIALKYVQAVIPAGSCSCSSNRSEELRRLCIGTATAPCDCDQGANCKCVDPYFREPGGTCTLDTDGDKIADYKDLCPYEYGENCPKAPPVSKCPQETDSTWKLFWRDTERGVTLYTRCPGGVNVSAGLANRTCGADGTWGEVDTTDCISRVFLEIEQRTEDVKQVLKIDNALTNKQREVITGITRDLSAALNVDNTLSVLPGDLTTTTNLVGELASLSDNNGLFSGQNNTEQQMAVVGVISGVLNSRNVPAFTATSKSTEQETPAESLLESTELLTRTGFVQQGESLPPSDAPPNKIEKVVVESNLVVQSNRLNSLSFTLPSFSVSFPSQEFNNFARTALIPKIIIPGGFLKALTGGSDGPGTQTPVPADSTTTLLTPSAASPTTSQTPPTTPPTGPTRNTNNQTIAKPVDVVSFTMNNLQKLLPLKLANEPDEPDGTRRIEPVSLIVSSQVAGVDNTAVDSGETIDISFTLLENAQNITVGPREKKEVKCAFWNFTGGRNGSGAWSFDGIDTVFENETHVECESKHLTSFVVLVSVVPIKEPPHPFFAAITYIGCGISLLCLLLSIVFFLALRKELITRLHNFVHLNLCIALSCGLIFFLGGMEHAAKYKIACQIVSVFQHYFFLAAFCWMLCEAIMIYILLVRVFGANDKKWIYLYLVLGWGLPVPVVVVSVAVRHYNYFILNTNNEILACWLPLTDGLIAAFIGPMLAILLVNAVLLTISMASLAKSKCGKNKEMGQDKKENAQTAWQLTKATLILMPLMGFTWVIGLLAVGPGRDVVAIVFVVLNSLQGLFIFLLHVVRHEKVWSKIKARLPTLKGKKFTLLTGPSSETKSTLTRSKKSTFTSKSFSSTGGHDVGLFGTESKEKPDDLASIKDGEDFEMKIKNGESTLDEQKVEVTATTFGIGGPNDKEEKTNSSPQPTESKPEQTTTTFRISEQNDKEDKTNSSPQPTESKPLLELTGSDQSPPPTTTPGFSPANVTVEYHSPGESDQPPCGGEAL